MSRTAPVVAPAMPDTPLLMLGAALLLVGLVAISSASIEYADWHYDNAWFHTQRHLIYMALAIAAAVVVYRVPLQFWQESGCVNVGETFSSSDHKIIALNIERRK